MNAFSPDYLFQTPQGASIPFDILTAGFAILFLAGAFVYWRRGKLSGDNPILRRLVRRLAKAGMWTSGIGLFLALMRYVQFPYLSMPILMYLLVLSMIIIAGYFVYDVSERYPLQVWELQEDQLAQRYRPAPRRRAEPQPIRPKVRGKRARR